MTLCTKLERYAPSPKQAENRHSPQISPELTRDVVEEFSSLNNLSSAMFSSLWARKYVCGVPLQVMTFPTVDSSLLPMAHNATCKKNLPIFESSLLYFLLHWRLQGHQIWVWLLMAIVHTLTASLSRLWPMGRIPIEIRDSEIEYQYKKLYHHNITFRSRNSGRQSTQRLNIDRWVCSPTLSSSNYGNIVSNRNGLL